MARKYLAFDIETAKVVPGVARRLKIDRCAALQNRQVLDSESA